MKVIVLFFGVCMIGVCLGVSRATAGELTADEVMKKAYETGFFPGKSQVCDVTLNVFTPMGENKIDQFRMFRVNLEKGDQRKVRIVFDRPATVGKGVQTHWTSQFAQDDKGPRFSVPESMASMTPSGILMAGAPLRTSYETDPGDISNHQSCRFMDQNIPKHYWIRCELAKPASGGYKYLLAWVRKDGFIPVKLEYYDGQDCLKRLVEVWRIKNVQGYPTVTNYIIRSLSGGADSAITFSNIRYDSTGANEPWTDVASLSGADDR